jgi:hypothetical protein
VYTYQLEVVDVSNNSVYSNALVLTAPWILAPSTIASVVGLDSALRIQLGATSNQLSGAGHTVEFVLKRADNTPIRIVKQYVASGSYTLSDADDAQLVNNTTYRVACAYQPSSSSTLYKSPSLMSNTITATPSNLPNAPSGVSASSVGTETLDISMSWVRPSDFSEWASGEYSITLLLVSSLGFVQTQVISNQDITQYTWTDLPSGQYYQLSLFYTNQFEVGPGAGASSNVTPSSIPDAPTLISVSDDDLVADLVWTAPGFSGQADISQYKIYKDGSLLATVSGSTFSYHATGLMNGYAYVFEVSAVNAVGESARSASLTASPFGQMSIVSVVASGKQLTATLNPNGRPIQSVVFVTLDQDPNNLADSDFVIVIPQQQISQVTTANVSVIKNFTDFTSDIDFFACIAHNATNSAFYKSA